MLTKLTKDKKAKREIRERIANLPCNAECTVMCYEEGGNYYANRTSADYYLG